VRRKLIRSCLLEEAKKRASEPKNEDTLEEIKKDKDASLKLTLGVSAFFLAIGATVFRFGGRAAFVQLLGLDFMTNVDMKGQVDTLVDSFNNLGDLKYVAFLFAWIIAKCVCIDFFTLVLALSSGVLFGGIGEGALASVTASSIASTVPFLFSRYSSFRKLAQIEINKRPTWRAVDKACSKDGFKTVFVLRLSPLLPIPIGMYNYLYGATSVSFSDFFLGLTLGSAKPYLLDSYLGVYGKSIMDGDNSQNDYLFAFVIFVLVLVGNII